MACIIYVKTIVVSVDVIIINLIMFFKTYFVADNCFNKY